MANLVQLNGIEHYRLKDLQKGETIDCPDHITQVSKIDENSVKLVLKKGKIEAKI